MISHGELEPAEVFCPPIAWRDLGDGQDLHVAPPFVFGRSSEMNRVVEKDNPEGLSESFDFWLWRSYGELGDETAEEGSALELERTPGAVGVSGSADGCAKLHETLVPIAG